MSHAARGMFPYVATEKDCVDEEGRVAECTICLEDFEAGDKMARLVCWCKFHEVCLNFLLFWCVMGIGVEVERWGLRSKDDLLTCFTDLYQGVVG
jgi:hypothetical protein